MFIQVKGYLTFRKLIPERRDEPSRCLMKTAMSQLNLSARAYHRVLKLARTIADLACTQTRVKKFASPAPLRGWAGVGVHS